MPTGSPRFTGQAPAGSAPDVTARLDALEHSVAQIRKGLDECLLRQKALADAITSMFERLAPSAGQLRPSRRAGASGCTRGLLRTAGSAEPATNPATPRPAVAPLSGPIADLSLND